MSDVSQILAKIDLGDPAAAEQLLPLVYDELRKLAAAKLAQEQPGQTLQATALVHEAYLRLAGQESGARSQESGKWNSRGHFFAAAAEAMRQILVNSAVRKRRPKHGGDRLRVDLDSSAALRDEPNEEILELDAALTKLSATEPLSAEVVKLKFFAGLSLPEVAAALGISPRTADRRWAYGRAWLHQELTRG
jgi:RNA polymerase sigma factor (TIGR02999 family)